MCMQDGNRIIIHWYANHADMLKLNCKPQYSTATFGKCFVYLAFYCFSRHTHVEEVSGVLNGLEHDPGIELSLPPLSSLIQHRSTVDILAVEPTSVVDPPLRSGTLRNTPLMPPVAIPGPTVAHVSLSILDDVVTADTPVNLLSTPIMPPVPNPGPPVAQISLHIPSHAGILSDAERQAYDAAGARPRTHPPRQQPTEVVNPGEEEDEARTERMARRRRRLHSIHNIISE